MARIEYRENRAALQAALARLEVPELERRAELGRIEAERIAPVRTGAYAFGAESAVSAPADVHGGGFKVTAGIKDGRAYARLSNDVHRGTYAYGVALEFGTSKMRKQRVLGRAIDAIASKK